MKKEKTKSIDELGFNIKKRREAKGASQAAIAKSCDVSVIAYQRWENGTTKQIRVSNFTKLREVLGDE